METNERDKWERLAQELKMPFVDLDAYQPDTSALGMLHAGVARRLRVVPIKLSDGTLYLAVADVTPPQVQEHLLVSGIEVRVVLATPSALERAIDRWYNG